MKCLRSILRDNAGQSMVEYAYLLALIALAVLGSLSALGVNVRDFFGRLQATM